MAFFMFAVVKTSRSTYGIFIQKLLKIDRLRELEADGETYYTDRLEIGY
jgi:hypothetical protein